MSLFSALILALVQGATEFLPVSSSGHLALVGKLLGLPEEQVPLDFVVVVHFGTLLSVLVFYRRDLWAMVRSLAPAGEEDDEARGERLGYRRLLGLLLLGTVPAAAAGLLLEDAVERLFGSVALVGAALLVTAGVLAAVSRLDGARQMARTGVREALVVGVAQALALAPGISRSGMTIAGGLVAGLRREWAPRFAFLLSVPVILGGSLVELRRMVGGVTGASFDPLSYLAATVTAAVSGYIAIVIVTDSVKRGNLLYFAAYCLAVGLAAIAWGLTAAG